MKVTFTPVTPLSNYLNPTAALQFVEDMKGTSWHELHKDGEHDGGYVMRLRSNGDYVIMGSDGSFVVKNLDGLLRCLSAWKLSVRRKVTKLSCVLRQQADTVDVGSLKANVIFTYDGDGEERQFVTITDGNDSSPNRTCLNLADMSQQFVLKTRAVQVIEPTGMNVIYDRK